jgi:hypothetical protein
MSVADLMDLLRQHNPAATVVLRDHTTYDSHVSKLRFEEVLPIQLGARECNGALVLEPLDDGDEDLQGPFPGLVLGSR